MIFDIKQKKLLLIAGPCVIESLDQLRHICETMKKLTEEKNIFYLFKASFDKANRSSVNSYRGPGLIKGLEMLYKIKQEFDVPILSDVHTPDMIKDASEVLDVLQIPAFLARQTDFYIEAAKCKKAISVKKGQFMSPYEMENILEKFKVSGGTDIAIIERGSSFGYGNLVVDFRSLPIIKTLGCFYIYDATHSLQLPAARGSSSGGQREFIPTLLRAQLAAGANGIFIETHPNPSQAKSDKETQYPLSQMEILLNEVLPFYQLNNENKKN